MSTQNTESRKTSFGDLRSLLAMPSFKTEDLYEVLAHYEGRVDAALQYIKDHLGYVPANVWTSDWQSSTTVCVSAMEALYDREHSPLRAYLLLGGKRILVKSWEDPHRELQKAIYPIREECAKIGRREAPDLAYLFDTCLVQHKAYAFSETAPDYLTEYEWQVSCEGIQDLLQDAVGDAIEEIISRPGEACTKQRGYDVLYYASWVSKYWEIRERHLKEFHQRIDVALLTNSVV